MILEDTPDWKQRFIERNRKLYLDNKEKIDKWYKKYSKYLTKKVYRKFEWNCGPKYTSFKNCIIQFRQSGLRIKKSDTFPSLVAIVNTPIIWDKNAKHFRYVTPKESAKLQSFNPDYNFCDSDVVTYRQLGNSVNVKLVNMFAESLFNLGKKSSLLGGNVNGKI